MKPPLIHDDPHPPTRDDGAHACSVAAFAAFAAFRPFWDSFSRAHASANFANFRGGSRSVRHGQKCQLALSGDSNSFPARLFNNGAAAIS